MGIKRSIAVLTFASGVVAAGGVTTPAHAQTGGAGTGQQSPVGVIAQLLSTGSENGAQQPTQPLSQLLPAGLLPGSS